MRRPQPIRSNATLLPARDPGDQPMMGAAALGFRAEIAGAEHNIQSRPFTRQVIVRASRIESREPRVAIGN
jgi:hypothetical protein